jgi:hypothetical protein
MYAAAEVWLGLFMMSAMLLLLLLLQALAASYPSLDVVMLWGNMNGATKELFRDQLLVSGLAGSEGSGSLMFFYCTKLQQQTDFFKARLFRIVCW